MYKMGFYTHNNNNKNLKLGIFFELEIHILGNQPSLLRWVYFFVLEIHILGSQHQNFSNIIIPILSLLLELQNWNGVG
jgi:hypothetical protein